MTEAQVLSLVLKFGPWAALLILTIYTVANRAGPTLLEEWREQRKKAREAAEAERKARTDDEKEDRKTIFAFYDRLVAQEGKVIECIASVAQAMDLMTRSQDANTQQLYRLTRTVEGSARCPLPNCPMTKEKAGPG